MNSRRLILGTVQMGMDYGVANRSGRVGVDEARAILEVARKNGIETLDTAAYYGESEATLGTLGMSGWNVVTKLRAVPDGCEDIGGWVHEEVEASMTRLGISSLYGILAHRPSQLLEPMGESIYSALTALQREGKVGRIGASIYGPEELDSLMPRYPLELIQAPFNLFDRRLAISGWLDECRTRGVEVHARSAFLQGALLMKREDRPAMFRRWDALWGRYEQWLSDSGVTPVRACLGFALAESRIDGVVVGVDGLKQFQELVEVVNSVSSTTFPDLATDDLDLINPSRWNNL